MKRATRIAVLATLALLAVASLAIDLECLRRGECEREQGGLQHEGKRMVDGQGRSSFGGRVPRGCPAACVAQLDRRSAARHRTAGRPRAQARM